jgi:signal transduction histidine kinase
MIMDETLSVLVIDDSSDDRMLYRRVLKEAFIDRLRITEEASGESGLAAIEKSEPHCVLLDYSLPGRNGIDVLKRIRAKHKYLPVILLTGQGNEAVAVQSMKEGAQDYITKAAITADTLSRVIRTAIENRALQKRVDEQHVALELFTQALAHDLREPVRTVCSFAQMICDGETDGDGRNEYMRHIRDAGDRMTLLIDAVLSYTQLVGDGAPEREIVSLGEAAAAASANLSALFRERGTTVTVDPLPQVTASRIQVIQLLQNLMSNAVNHSPNRVHINVSAAREGDAVRVAVHDNGPGIAPDHQDQIFEPFRRLTRDNRRCGLGLAVSRKIVETHGGKIGCESAVGAGSTFSFTFSSAAPRTNLAGKTEATVERPAPAGHGSIANVLLVDDRDDDIWFTRTSIAGRRGMRCNLLVAHNGKEGLAALREQVAKNDPVDLILLDINMPVMNGFEMLEAMGEDPELNHIPVVMCSGSTREKDKERSRALGALGYLDKPVRFGDLQPIIANSSRIRLVFDAAGSPTLTRAS